MTQEDKLVLHTTWFGSFLFKGEEIVGKKLFPKDADKIARKQLKINQEIVLEEEEELVEEIGHEVYVSSIRLTELGEKLEDYSVPETIEKYSYEPELLQEALQKLGRIELKESINFGQHLAKAVSTIQDLNETINILNERLRDWYSLHHPELEEEVGEDRFLELIEQFGNREKMKDESEISSESVGGDITETEENHYKSLAALILQNKKFRSELWGYVENRMREMAPTITELTGPKLGAELIKEAGSLEKLAKMPSSTIQVLGAEKALFRHLDTGAKPPKHGLILQHPYVHKAEQENRGKIARAFANKIAIAARVDYFGSENKGPQLREELEERIKEIKG